MKATTITAKHTSLCPHCHCNIFPGTKARVYYDKWYHYSCWGEIWDSILEKKEFEKLQEERDKQIEMEIPSKVNELRHELADELRGIVLQIEVLTGRVREISREMGAEW